MTSRRQLFLTLVTVLVVVATTPAFAAIRVVDCGGGSFPTITAALGAAGNGDTIVVHDCTYNENITIAGFTGLHLVAASATNRGATRVGVGTSLAWVPPAEIDGTGLPDDCIRVVNSTDVTIVGFHITNCNDNGVAIYNSEHTLLHANRIDQVGQSGLPALAAVLSDTSFNTQVVGNLIRYGTAAATEGLRLENCTECTVGDNIIRDNTGVGIHLVAGSYNTVANNNVRSNASEGILVEGFEARIERNTCRYNAVPQLVIGTAARDADGVGNLCGAVRDRGVGTELQDNY
jgi:parallel beta-helix repeat protein